MSNYHTSVLLHESIDALDIKKGGVYVDLTFGGGGHSKEILSRLSPDATLISFDQDSAAMNNIPEDERLIFVASNFKYMRGALRARGIEKVDGIIADLGVSSHHFDNTQRGFSFRGDAKLDMRMNSEANLTAYDVVNTYEHKALMEIIRDYGELKMPQKIASEIERKRPIETTLELVEATKFFAPPSAENKFYSKLFQAIRIEVNGELEALKMALEQSNKMLKKGGRLSVITYHSLEDRIVKNFVKSGNFEGKVETDFFGNSSQQMKSVGKVILPSQQEIQENSRARSAKLRVAEKI